MMNENELLIIGNGFDLSAGLKSTYKDFFEKRYDLDLINEMKQFLRSGYNNPKKLKELDNINLWDIFFLFKYLDDSNKNKNWSNIEEEIKFFLTSNKDKQELTKDGLKTILKTERQGYGPVYPENNYNQYAKQLLSYINKSDGLNDLNLDEFINFELQLFETVFAKYIEKISKNSMHYHMKSNLLVENLVSDTSKTSIISFNYTNIKKEGLLNIQNVHGKSNEKIIFGIDYKDLIYHSEEYKYSKTYRKLLMNVYNTINWTLPKGISKIKFYGHSLSDADYSYFQSIFDFYSIYDSEVIIEMLFCVFDENYREVILNNQLLAVTRLFSIYSDTMTNKEHGKNLIHKLLLENRLRIIEVNSNGETSMEKYPF